MGSAFGNLGPCAGEVQAGMNVALQDDHDSEGEYVISLSKRKLKLRSGMMAKPTDNIKSPEVWPHFNLNYGYVMQTIEFHQLTFEQYIAGEGKTLLNCTDPNELRGRLNLMIRLAYLKQEGFTWPNLRTLYAAIVNHIETHETTWVSDWRHIEDMVLETGIRVPREKSGGKPTKHSKTPPTNITVGISTGQKDVSYHCRMRLQLDIAGQW